MNAKTLVLLMSFILLNGCQPKTPRLLQNFTLKGAIAAKSAKKIWTAHLIWQYTNSKNYQITLIGPINSKTVFIQNKQGVITYEEGRKKIITNDPNTLLEKNAGIKLPLDALLYWIQGQPAPQSSPQNNYKISYPAYSNTPKGQLPQKIHIEGDHLSVKLFIKTWHFNS